MVASGRWDAYGQHGFPNLKRRIEAKHPEFVAEGVELVTGDSE